MEQDLHSEGRNNIIQSLVVYFDLKLKPKKSKRKPWCLSGIWDKSQVCPKNSFGCGYKYLRGRSRRCIRWLAQPAYFDVTLYFWNRYFVMLWFCFQMQDCSCMCSYFNAELNIISLLLLCWDFGHDSVNYRGPFYSPRVCPAQCGFVDDKSCLWIIVYIA